MNFKKIVSMMCVCTLAFSAVGCASGGGGDQTKDPNAAVELNILNWGDYMAPEVIPMFEKEFPNIKVNQTVMESNEYMYVALESDTNGFYDMCFPSDYAIEALLQKDLIAPINYENIPNFKNIMAKCKDVAFDPGNKYSVPYMWGTVGILYNKTKVTEPVDSWNILWNEKYKNQIIMYDIARDSMAAALKKNGFSLNTKDEAQIQKAGEDLMVQKPLVRAYATDTIKDTMINNGAALALVYSGDAIYAMDENADLDYAVPKEGSNIWFDNMVITKRSKNKEASEKFIDFLCRPDIAKLNTEYIGYTTANQAAYDLLDEDKKTNAAYMPSEDVIANCEVYVDLGDKIPLYDELWTKIKSK